MSALHERSDTPPPPQPGAAAPGGIAGSAASASPHIHGGLGSIKAWTILETLPEPRFGNAARGAAHLLAAPAALVVLTGRKGPVLAARHGLEAREGLAGNAFAMQAMRRPDEPVVVEDVQFDPRFANDPLVAGGIRFCVAIPLREPDGACAGALCVLDRRPRKPTDADLERLQEAAWALSEVLFLRRNVVALCQAALHDPVTGAGNRTAFECGLDRTIARAGRHAGFAVLCVKTDRLQSVNAMFGHVGGDALLRQLAARIGDALPEDATLARIGAEEFAVLLPGAGGIEAARTADELIEALARPVEVCGQTMPAHGHVGFALYPEDGDRPALLLDRAEATLEEARRGGGDSVRRFEVSIERESADKHELAEDLRRAIEESQIYLYWQPVCDAATRQPVGYEALLRWDRPGHGPVPPSQFVGAAEASGLSNLLDAWVLRTACKEAASWPDTSLRASVNVSVNRIRFGDLSDLVVAALAESGLSPARLEIEMPERILTEEEGAVRRGLESLRALGVRITLDDFGTGMSCLSYLRSLPLDKLKLDRSLTRDVAGDQKMQEMANTVVRLGNVLGLIVLAEGVENEEQLACLRLMGCDEAQGYLLGWPRPITAGQGPRSGPRSMLQAAG